jgi:hypothetical protein
MTRRELILKDLQEVYNKLHNARVDLEIENNESQFDYCTSSRLSDLFNNIESVVKKIDKIIYQK